MDRTIRNLDEDLYRSLKAQAALTQNSIGELVNQAIRSYLRHLRAGVPKRGSFMDLKPMLFPPGNENLSREIDQIAYEDRR